jgi:hypothetical protein
VRKKKLIINIKKNLLCQDLVNGPHELPLVELDGPASYPQELRRVCDQGNRGALGNRVAVCV